MGDSLRLFGDCVGIAVMLLLAKDEPLVRMPFVQALRWLGMQPAE